MIVFPFLYIFATCIQVGRSFQFFITYRLYSALLDSISRLFHPSIDFCYGDGILLISILIILLSRAFASFLMSAASFLSCFVIFNTDLKFPCSLPIRPWYNTYYTNENSILYLWSVVGTTTIFVPFCTKREGTIKRRWYHQSFL